MFLDHNLSSVNHSRIRQWFYYQIGTRTVGETFYWDQSGSNNTDVIDQYTLLEANIGYTLDDWNLNLLGLI